MYAYNELVSHVLEHGVRKENRTGIDTLSTFNYNYELAWDPAVYPHRPASGERCHLIDRLYGVEPPDVAAQKTGIPFPLLTTKAVSWKNIVTEMLWFLSGQTNLDILRRHGCKFWDDWADERGEVPSAYGNFWRHFPVHTPKPLCSGCGQVVYGPHGCPGPDSSRPPANPPPEPAFNDQIAWVLAELRRNPMSRRMVVSAWAPGNAQTSKLPPCHAMFVLNVQNISPTAQEVHYGHNFGSTPVCGNRDSRVILPHGTGMQPGMVWCPDCQSTMQQVGGIPLKNPASDPDPRRLCLHLTQRSCDVALGVPYNIASYALLLCLFSHLSGIKPGIFAHTLIDAHIYTAKPDGSKAEFDHVPGLREQIGRSPRPLPRLIIDPSIRELSDIEALMAPGVTTDEILQKFRLEGYDPHPAIPFRVAV